MILVDNETQEVLGEGIAIEGPNKKDLVNLIIAELEKHGEYVERAIYLHFKQKFGSFATIQNKPKKNPLYKKK